MTPKLFVNVDTEYGPVKGCKKTTVLGLDYINFQGIPYMKSPEGKLRFRDAQAPEKWTEPLDVSEEGPSFPNRDIFFTQKIIGKEDAGVVNVYTKDVSPNKLFPVLFYIHGGGWLMGSNSSEVFGPDYILQKDVVLVVVNYRIGALGFLSLKNPELKVPGNQGLKDQIFSLKWLKRNISKFGGDPNNVTIFGESAGGASVHYLMISDAAKGLFHKAILMSGVALNQWALHPLPDHAYRLAVKIGYEGSKDESEVLEFLESVDAYELVTGDETIMTEDEMFREKRGMMTFSPTIEPYLTENCVIPKHPLLMLREAWSKDMDIMIGGTSFEGLVMAAPVKLFNDLRALKALEDSKNFTPFLELSLDFEDEKSEEIGKMLKETYYGKFLKPSKTNIEGYFYYMSDLMFWHGIQRVVQSRVTLSKKGKTFLYRFDVTGELNFAKKVSQVEEFAGAEHFADCCYLFKVASNPLPAIVSKEFDNIKKTVAIWTSFAINGDPNSDEIGLGEEEKWRPVELGEWPMKCLNIGTDENLIIDLPETERLNVWNMVYDKAGVDLY